MSNLNNSLFLSSLRDKDSIWYVSVDKNGTSNSTYELLNLSFNPTSNFIADGLLSSGYNAFINFSFKKIFKLRNKFDFFVWSWLKKNSKFSTRKLDRLLYLTLDNSERLKASLLENIWFSLFDDVLKFKINVSSILI